MKNEIKSGALFVCFLAICHLLSCSQSVKEEKTVRPVSFAGKFNAGAEDASLLLACIVYAKESRGHLNLDSTAGFYEVSNTLLDYSEGPAIGHIDSAIDAFIASNKPIDFSTQQAQRRIFLFKQGYRILDLIFAGIEDDRDDLAKVLEEKIDKVPEVSKIYRSYVSKDRVLSSLASSEGSALMIHLAYYFSKLDDHKRNAVLKLLL